MDDASDAVDVDAGQRTGLGAVLVDHPAQHLVFVHLLDQAAHALRRAEGLPGELRREDVGQPAHSGEAVVACGQLVGAIRQQAHAQRFLLAVA